jgi:hypothetical protein
MDGNRWIITAIDHTTVRPIAKAIHKATVETIAEFIYDEIYMHYGAPQEIFTNGRKNLRGGANTLKRSRPCIRARASCCI